MLQNREFHRDQSNFPFRRMTNGGNDRNTRTSTSSEDAHIYKVCVLYHPGASCCTLIDVVLYLLEVLEAQLQGLEMQLNLRISGKRILLYRSS